MTNMNTDTNPSSTSRAALLLLCLVVTATGICAYSNSFQGGFVFDDQRVIVENPHLRNLWPVGYALWSPPRVATAGRPVVSLSLALNYAISKLEVWSYHAMNLTIHILAGLCLFGIVRRTLSRGRWSQQYAGQASGIALACALIWVVHPLQTECVTYISTRTESLAGLFFLSTFYCFIRGLNSPQKRKWNIAAIVFCALGMGSKEVMVSAPILILLYDRCFVSSSFRESLKNRRALYLGLFATWILLGGLLTAKMTLLSFGDIAGFHFEKLTPHDYAATQCGIILHYLRLCFLPDVLLVDYSDWPLARSFVEVWPAAVVLLLLLVGVTLSFKYQPWLGFLGAWFFIILAPTSSILPMPTEVGAERRMYLPLAAVTVLAVIVFYRLLELLFRRIRWTASLHKSLAVVLLLGAVISLGYRTVQRNRDYRSDLVLWQDLIDKRPDNPRAHNNLGRILADQGNLRQAVIHYTRTLKSQPNHVWAHNNLATVLLKLNKIDLATIHCREALRLRPEYAEAHNNMGNILIRQGKVPEACDSYAMAVQFDPKLMEAQNNLGITLAQQGQLEEAQTRFLKALEISPDNLGVHQNLGTVLTLLGQEDQAQIHFDQAARLKAMPPGNHATQK